jgi:hypothetical protein
MVRLLISCADAEETTGRTEHATRAAAKLSLERAFIFASLTASARPAVRPAGARPAELVRGMIGVPYHRS